MKQIYLDLIGQEPMNYELIKPKKRIAIMLPDQSLDIMKVLNVVQVKDETIAVAKVCPGQGSFILDSDGNIRLNDLIDTLPLTPTTQYAIGMGYCTDYPGWEDSHNEYKAIGRKSRAHWRPINSERRICQVRKDQMRVMMEYVNNLLI